MIIVFAFFIPAVVLTLLLFRVKKETKKLRPILVKGATTGAVGENSEC